MTAYPAITVYQPWASLIAAGCKPFEFRRWAAPHALVGRRVAIHAGARPVKKAEVADLLLRLRQDGGRGTGLRVDPSIALLERVHTSPGALPLSSVLCLATLGLPRKASALFRGEVADSDRIDQHVWGWPLSDIEVLEPFVPARGAQGWWTWTHHAMAPGAGRAGRLADRGDAA